jgi:hypothetical protein
MYLLWTVVTSPFLGHFASSNYYLFIKSTNLISLLYWAGYWALDCLLLIATKNYSDCFSLLPQQQSAGGLESLGLVFFFSTSWKLNSITYKIQLVMSWIDVLWSLLFTLWWNIFNTLLNTILVLEVVEVSCTAGFWFFNSSCNL